MKNIDSSLRGTAATATYFRNMRSIGEAYETARIKRFAEKETLKQLGNWDAVKAWNAREEKEFPYPFSKGQTSAYRAWENSMANESSIFEVKDLPWERDLHDFVSTLREAGLTEFAVTDQSTALMQILHLLADEEGCRLTGLCKVTRSERRWGNEGTEEYDGILMSL